MDLESACPRKRLLADGAPVVLRLLRRGRGGGEGGVVILIVVRDEVVRHEVDNGRGKGSLLLLVGGGVLVDIEGLLGAERLLEYRVELLGLLRRGRDGGGESVVILIVVGDEGGNGRSKSSLLLLVVGGQLVDLESGMSS